MSEWKEFPAADEAYDDIRDYIVDAAICAGISEKRILKLELGVEEVVVNVINYAYENPGEIFIQVDYNAEKKEFALTIVDYGVEFNPLKKNDPRAVDKSQIEDRKLGGFGIAFIKKIFDRLNYERKDFNGKPANYFELVFKAED